MCLGDSLIRKGRPLASPCPASILSVYPHLTALPLGADICRTSNLGLFFLKICRELRIRLQLYKNIQKFTRRQERVIILITTVVQKHTKIYRKTRESYYFDYNQQDTTTFHYLLLKVSACFGRFFHQ